MTTTWKCKGTGKKRYIKVHVYWVQNAVKLTYEHLWNQKNFPGAMPRTPKKAQKKGGEGKEGQGRGREVEGRGRMGWGRKGRRREGKGTGHSGGGGGNAKEREFRLVKAKSLRIFARRTADSLLSAFIVEL
jgi:hypothetical protein